LGCGRRKNAPAVFPDDGDKVVHIFNGNVSDNLLVWNELSGAARQKQRKSSCIKLFCLLNHGHPAGTA
jgi:hypothetical protein